MRVGLGGKLKKPDIDAKHQTGQQSVLPPGLASWSGEHGTHRRWQRETGRNELHRASRVLRVKINCVPQQFVTRLLRSKRFSEFRARLGANPEGRAREKAHNAVATRVHKQRRGDFVGRGILRTERADGFDRVRIGFF